MIRQRKWALGLPLKLVIVITSCLFLGDWLSEGVQRGLYTMSLAIMSSLIFILPAIIFAYVFSCITSLKQGSWAFVILLLLLLSLSNMLSTLIAYTSSWLAGMCTVGMQPADIDLGKGLTPYWTVDWPKWISNNHALFAALGLGILCNYLRYDKAEKLASVLKRGADAVLQRGLIPIIPVFLLGFLLNINHEGASRKILLQYSSVLAIMVGSQLSYITLLYGLGFRFKMKAWLMALKNVLPSGITGFSTMSSAASMPLTLKGAQANTKNSEKVNSIVPITVNIHLIGDSIGIPILALGILNTFGYGFPHLGEYLPFALFFVLAQYAVAGVPGGTIIIMLPILEQYLGFNDSMLSLITTLYILFDPFFTMANVLGNGAFAVLYTKLYDRIEAYFGEIVAIETSRYYRKKANKSFSAS